MTNDPPARRATRTSDWLTVPNLITVARLLLIVPVAVIIARGEDSQRTLALALLTVFGLTDWVDGAVARRFGQVSELGEVLDPIVDRVGVGVIAAAMVLGGHLEVWVVLLIIVVDVTVGTAFLIVRPAHHPEVTPIGKARTALLMVGFILTGVGMVTGAHAVAAAGRAVCAVGAVAHTAAGVGYVRAIVRSGRRPDRRQGPTPA